jgi:hypothetical protein
MTHPVFVEYGGMHDLQEFMGIEELGSYNGTYVLVYQMTHVYANL